jgi:hypothetical protein
MTKTLPGHALALLGWYLMVPSAPSKYGEGWKAYFAHLLHPPGFYSGWDIAQSFDSAKECETRRQELVTASLALKQTDIGTLRQEFLSDGASTKQADAWIIPVEKASQVRCIASDDPRLAK